ncbi:hypothetical protein [Desulfotalea psychrophila]|uniref:Uncharacterized protein n=1 Tax=Desulfotalea psychrophila (strain LSv54 / DSM 12343) TaxID=177439 RepID=Q6ALT3_DESPS|nr:hypothetical protein [Desulfotalea psychrophila]CAG36692.1 unknown protein [Desulfotalea psychrophila LSv54]
MRLRRKINILVVLFVLLLPSLGMARVSIPSGLTYEKDAQVGGSYRGSIQLLNPGEDPQEVKVYQSDYLFYADGSNSYGEPGKDVRSNADWISFSPRRLIIPAGGSVQVAYIVDVPSDQVLTGTYWSLLLVEGISASSPEAGNGAKGVISVGIQQIMRYGLQMITNIGNTGTHSLKFVKTKILKTDGKRILQIDLENTGERWLRPILWTELYDEKNNSVGKFEGEQLRIYPTTSARFKIDLSQVPKGTYKALVVADAGGDDMFGANYTLKFD